MVTHSRYVGAGCDDFKEALVDDVTTVTQRRLKHDAGPVYTHMYQQDLLRYELQLVVRVAESVAVLSAHEH